MRISLLVLVCLCLHGWCAAFASEPVVVCAEAPSGSVHTYSYNVVSTGQPLLEFRVGTNDLEYVHYSEVVSPEGWTFEVLAEPLAHAHGTFTPHGDVSSPPCECGTLGCVRWWTDEPILAVEAFTFGFDHDAAPENVGWFLVRQDALLVDTESDSEDWLEPVGLGGGPVHGPSVPLSPVIGFGAAEAIQANGIDIVVPGYSVPSFVDWNADGLNDLIVGEGGDDSGHELPGKVRVYLNVGTSQSPSFGTYFYAQSGSSDLSVPGQGCQGAFPRVTYWDGDDRKDLLVGRADGMISLFLNVGTDAAPLFDRGTILQAGEPEEEDDIDVFYRATPVMADWNNDGRKDLIVGSVDALFYVYLNDGTDASPHFGAVAYATMYDGSLLTVPSTRSSPEIVDLDGDGRKDILAGDREGQLLYYRNVGADEAPVFARYARVRAAGVPIDYPEQPRSRPFVCDWTGDGVLDVLVGAGDGLVRLYQGVLGDMNVDGFLDSDDVLPFVEALVDPAGYDMSHPAGGLNRADCNGDGHVDGRDVPMFTHLLLVTL